MKESTNPTVQRGNATRKQLESPGGRTPEFFASMHVGEIFEKVPLENPDTLEKATEICHHADRSPDVTPNPSTVAACAIYIATALNGAPLPRKTVADAAGCNVDTIGRNWPDVARAAGLDDITPGRITGEVRADAR